LTKKLLIKRTSAIFLAIVLVTGTIAAISPFMGIVQAQSYYNGGMDDRYNSYGPTPEHTDKKYSSY
jgi:hypothetical protein